MFEKTKVSKQELGNAFVSIESKKMLSEFLEKSTSSGWDEIKALDLASELVECWDEEEFLAKDALRKLGDWLLSTSSCN